jgi:restriction system protein
MAPIVWIVVIGLIGYAGLAVLSWIFELISALYKGTENVSSSASSKFIDFVGRKRLAPNFSASHDLFDLEKKLEKKDIEKDQIKNYNPAIAYPPDLKEEKYPEEWKKLFSRHYLGANNHINIEDLQILKRLSEVPAYKRLESLSENSLPLFSTPQLIPPEAVSPPIEWERWGCEPQKFHVPVHYYTGVLSLLNCFVKRSFQASVNQASVMRRRQENALGLANKRNEELELLHQEALKRYGHAKRIQEDLWKQAQSKYEEFKKSFLYARTTEFKKICSLIDIAREATISGLIARAEQTLKLENFPLFVSTEFSLKFDQDSKILILEQEFPDIGRIKWHKSVQLKSGTTLKPANKTEIKEGANILYPALSLRLACELVRLDLDGMVDAIVVNGWSDYVEKSTGQLKRAYCSSLFATKHQLLDLNLSSADALAAFSKLKGVAARSLELTPIAPILRLNTDDKRFVDAKEVIGNLKEGENLAAMDWEDFEHLCRQLFEKAFAGSGAEVKVTQASRDQGVDAVIFDPDVLRGGKIVVQAKRYTNTVDVSAVRDLYGAVINEGATKGILVTTSHYGPDAYAFAKDKPITLLNGGELLGLLQKYGYMFRIDLTEAKKLNAEISGSYKKH